MKTDSTNNSGTSFKNYIRDHILDLLLGIPSLVTIVGYIKKLVSIIAGLDVRFTKLELLLGAAVLLMTLLWIILLRRRFSIVGHSYHQYKVLEIKYVYKRNEDNTYSITKKLKIRSKINGLRNIIQKIPWPEANAILPAMYKGIDSISPVTTYGIFKYFSVNLPRILSAGDEASIGYRWRDLPNCVNSYSFASVNTEYPTSSIEIVINLGSEYAGKEVFIEEFRSIDSECPLRTTCATFNEEGIFTWKPNKVKRFRYYRVRWNWIREEPKEEPQLVA